MSIPFAKARDPKLGLLDTLQFGKLKGCRVCDVVQDYYEYLIWASAQGYVQFQKEVTDLIAEQVNLKYVEEDPKERVKDTYNKFMATDWDDDIPF